MPDCAIIYGINNYKHDDIPDLRGCVNDTISIRNLLVSEYGFRRSNIVTREDRHVRLDAVQSDWGAIIANATAGDRLVFHFSGHGSFVPDTNGDEKDKFDEILCLYDMDYDDPTTYLTDDKLYEFTQQIPEGVRVTFLLDCCHSGSGTRSIPRPTLTRSTSARSPKQSLGLEILTDTADRAESPSHQTQSRTRSISSSQRAIIGGHQPRVKEHVVLARFVQPPGYRASERNLKRMGERSVKSMNHVLLSGCRDNQTSADAYIDGDYRGAFSHFLCEEVRSSGGELTHSALVERVRSRLSKQRFSQVPQLEPDDKLNTKLFEALGTSSGGSTHVSGNRTEPDDARQNSTSSAIDALGRKIDRLVDVVEQMSQGRVRSSEQAPAARSSPGSPGSPTGEPSLVYVHGICPHLPGYSDEWFRSLSRHLDARQRSELESNRREVLWSHLVDRTRSGSRSSSERTVARSRQEEQLAQELRDVLQDRAAQAMEWQIGTNEGNPEGDPDRDETRGVAPNQNHVEQLLSALPGLDCVDDFVQYLSNKAIRQNVIDEFNSVVRPMLVDGSVISIIAHSWGSVVALEAMHQLSDESFAGHVAHFFTVGSALSIRPVQRRIRFGAETGRKPPVVEQWVNLDARGDIVGGTLKAFPFDVDTEHLHLPPTSCGLLATPACAHRSYFNIDNVRVNRHIFAKLIGQAAR